MSLPTRVRCGNCGGELQATLIRTSWWTFANRATGKVYVERVHDDPPRVDHAIEIRIYCENDCRDTKLSVMHEQALEAIVRAAGVR